MDRVTGIGGVFFTAREPEAMRAWYRDHLGIDVQPWGGASFTATAGATTAWAINAAGERPFTVNYRVADLRALLDVLRAEGCEVVDAFEESELGTFGWVIDPEGNQVELWEPPAGR